MLQGLRVVKGGSPVVARMAAERVVWAIRALLSDPSDIALMATMRHVGMLQSLRVVTGGHQDRHIGCG